MRRTHEMPNALRAGTQPAYLPAFQKANDTLERIQKNLEEYLETKRMSFPRFYFLSNDELLEILAQTKNVQAVQPHMSKCFDGIRSLDFGSDPRSIDILAMCSAEGERVALPKNLKARGGVEQWLTAVEQAMVQSLRRFAKEGHASYANTLRTSWVLQQAAQLVILVSQARTAGRSLSALSPQPPLAALPASDASFWLDAVPLCPQPHLAALPASDVSFWLDGMNAFQSTASGRLWQNGPQRTEYTKPTPPFAAPTTHSRDCDPHRARRCTGAAASRTASRQPTPSRPSPLFSRRTKTTSAT